MLNNIYMYTSKVHKCGLILLFRKVRNSSNGEDDDLNENKRKVNLIFDWLEFHENKKMESEMLNMRLLIVECL